MGGVGERTGGSRYAATFRVREPCVGIVGTRNER